jgi:hypothetical protein
MSDPAAIFRLLASPAPASLARTANTSPGDKNKYSTNCQTRQARLLSDRLAAALERPGVPMKRNAASDVYGEVTTTETELPPMRAILLWLLGIPIPIIILLYIFGVF